MTEDEMVGWHHQLNEPELEQVLGNSEGQGSLASCGPWGCKEADTTKRLKNNNNTCINLLAKADAPEDSSLIPESRRPPEEEIATHSSILAWEISWTEKPGRLQSTGLQRVRHDLATKTLPPPPFPLNPTPGNHHCPLCFYEFDFFFFFSDSISE